VVIVFPAGLSQTQRGMPPPCYPSGMINHRSFWALLAGMILVGCGGLAHARVNKVAVEAFPEYAVYRAGSPTRVAFVFHVPAGHHTFWNHSGPRLGSPASIEWKLPGGWQAQGLQFPAPQRFLVGPEVVWGYAGEVVFFDTLIPPLEEEAAVVTVRARLTWQVAGSETNTEEESFTLSFERAGKAPARPLRADKFRLWLDRIPQVDHDLHPRVERGFLGKKYTLVFPGTRGEARPQFFPENPSLFDVSQPLKARFVTGQWRLELPFLRAEGSRAKTLSGVLDPGPSGSSPVTLSVPMP